MSSQQPTDTATPSGKERPARERVFYANAVNFVYNAEREAIIDFKLVMPEDFKPMGQPDATANLADVPVEVRVYMPFDQFRGMCQRMSEAWTMFSQSQKKEE